MMEQRLLRAAYSIEFLIALMAAFEFWSQVGGQSHLDLMTWWWKAGLSIAVAASVVKLTWASSRKQALVWIAVLTVLLFTSGLVTYYYHLNEPQDEEDQTDQVVPTSLKIHLQLPRPVGKLQEQSPVVL